MIILRWLYGNFEGHVSRNVKKMDGYESLYRQLLF